MLASILTGGRASCAPPPRSWRSRRGGWWPALRPEPRPRHRRRPTPAPSSTWTATGCPTSSGRRTGACCSPPPGRRRTRTGSWWTRTSPGPWAAPPSSSGKARWGTTTWTGRSRFRAWPARSTSASRRACGGCWTRTPTASTRGWPRTRTGSAGWTAWSRGTRWRCCASSTTSWSSWATRASGSRWGSGCSSAAGRWGRGPRRWVVVGRRVDPGGSRSRAALPRRRLRPAPRRSSPHGRLSATPGPTRVRSEGGFWARTSGRWRPRARRTGTPTSSSIRTSPSSACSAISRSTSTATRGWRSAGSPASASRSPTWATTRGSGGRSPTTTRTSATCTWSASTSRATRSPTATGTDTGRRRPGPRP